MADLQVTLALLLENQAEIARQLAAAGGQAGDDFGRSLSAGAQKAFDELVRQAEKAAKDAGLRFNRVKLQFETAGGEVIPQATLDRIGRVNKGFQEARQAVDAFRSAVVTAGREGDRSFSLLDNAIQGVAFSISNVMANGVVAFGQSAVAAVGRVVGEFAQLDTELRKAAAADGGVGAYDQLAATVDRVGIDAAGTTLEVAQLTTELIRGGLTANQVNDSLAAIVRGAEATGTGFQRMGTDVAAALKIFQIPASDATRVVDALAQGANSSAASVEGLGYGLAYAGPVAKQLGISLEDTVAMLGLLTNAGIDASSAGVTLRNGLSQLAAAAPKSGEGMKALTGQAKVAAETIKSMGLNIFEANGQLKPTEEVLLRLKAAFEQLQPAARMQIASDMFGGADDGSRWLALLGNSVEEIQRLTGAMGNTKGSTDRARNAMEGFELKLKQLEGTLGSISMTFGAVAVGALLPLVDAANTVVGAISGIPGPIKATAAAGTLLVGSLVAARVAIVVFNQALQAAVAQEAIARIVSLGGAIRAGLVADLARGAAAFRSFTLAATAASTVSVGAAGSAALAAITTGATAAASAVRGLATAVASGTLINGIRALAAGGAATLAGWAPLLPLAALLGLVAANVAVWSETTRRAKEVSDAFGDSQKKAADALRSVGVAAKESQGPMERLNNFMRTVGDNWAFLELSKQSQELQGKLDALQEPAIALLRSLRGASQATAEQKKEAGQLTSSLDVLATAARGTADKLRAQAKEAEKAGSPELASALRVQAQAFDVNARAATYQADALRKSAGLEQAKTATTNKNTSATSDNTKALQENAEARKRRLDVSSMELTVSNDELKLLGMRISAQQELGSALQNLAQAQAAYAQSEFDLEKARISLRLSAEEQILDTMRQAGASQEAIANQLLVIKGLKEQEIMLEVQAARDRITNLAQAFDMERQILDLKQQSQRLEAESRVNQAYSEKLQQEGQLYELLLKRTQAADAGNQAEVEKYDQLISLAQARVGIASEITQNEAIRLQNLDVIFGLERKTLGVTQETQANKERAAAAQQGYEQQLQGSLQLLDKSAQGFATAGGTYGKLADALRSGKKPIDDIYGTSNNLKNPIISATDEVQRLSKGFIAANSFAQDLLRTIYALAKAPQARWAGGGVTPGVGYQVNELGTESFLSSGGILSLIRAPAYGTWSPPSPGMVLPAGLTARLDALGAFEAGGIAPQRLAAIGPPPSSSSTGKGQAVVLGRLQRSIDRLEGTMRSYSPAVTVNLPNNAGMLHTLQSLR